MKIIFFSGFEPRFLSFNDCMSYIGIETPDLNCFVLLLKPIFQGDKSYPNRNNKNTFRISPNRRGKGYYNRRPERVQNQVAQKKKITKNASNIDAP